MAHVFVMIEGKQNWMEIFLKDLDKRRYHYAMCNGKTGYIQANPREIKLFDISIPQECIPQLMADFSPFAENSSNSRSKAHLLGKTIRNVTGLYSVFDMQAENRRTRLKNFILETLKLKKKVPFEAYKNTHQIRKRWLNIIPIGWAKDKYLGNDNTFSPALPRGGELI